VRGVETEFGPGEPGHLGGRCWSDLTGDGVMNEGDRFFLCPVLRQGRTVISNRCRRDDIVARHHGGFFATKNSVVILLLRRFSPPCPANKKTRQLHESAGFFMVGVRRFELPTTATPLRCATRLRYTPNKGGILR
jgi:hypothetical protein